MGVCFPAVPSSVSSALNIFSASYLLLTGRDSEAKEGTSLHGHLCLRKQRPFWNPDAHPQAGMSSCPLSYWAHSQACSIPSGVTMTGSHAYSTLPGLEAADRDSVSCSFVLNSFVTPVDCSPPGSSVHGILQARILEWVAISFPRGAFWPRDRTQNCRQILYPLSHQGSLGSSWASLPWSPCPPIRVQWVTKRGQESSGVATNVSDLRISMLACVFIKVYKATGNIHSTNTSWVHATSMWTGHQNHCWNEEITMTQFLLWKVLFITCFLGRMLGERPFLPHTACNSTQECRSY